MGRLRKSFSLLLVVFLAASSLVMAEVAVAQSIPKLLVPEVTINFVRASYNVTDSSTGLSRQIENNTIEFKIKNQPLPTDNSDIAIFYLIQFKDHYKENFAPIYSTATYHIQSKTEYTVMEIPLNNPPLLPPVNSTVVDFQVQAQIGHYSQTDKPGYIPGAPVQFQSGDGYTETNFDPIEKSDWSNTQTVNLANGSVSTSTLNATTTPTVPEFSWFAILPLLASVIGAAVILRHRKIRKMQ